MTEPPNDPNLNWDGQRWLRWNGSSWQPVGAQQPSAAPAPPPPPQPPPTPPSAPPTGGYYPPAPAGPPPRSPKRGLPVGAVIGICIGVVLVLIIIGGGATYLLTRSSNQDTANNETVSILTEPVSTANNPFTPPIPPAGTTTTDVAVPQPVTTKSPVTVKGGQVGLYGGTEKVSQCDKAKLIAFLAENPAKAAAWAQVQGISASQIPDFVNKLTQVVLRSDTLVTNHGWENGALTTFESVLQYGTAVLVNDRGLPVVKCYCGNPLSAAQAQPKVNYHGPTWSGWNPQSITIIETNITIINDFTVINITNNQPFGRPTGTDGAQD
ncbi:MAG: DUF6777 domain-containing protein, partial [Actinomycetes bacterium]